MGSCVGFRVGSSLGRIVGERVGSFVGLNVGSSVGLKVGGLEGESRWKEEKKKKDKSGDGGVTRSEGSCAQEE